MIVASLGHAARVIRGIVRVSVGTMLLLGLSPAVARGQIRDVTGASGRVAQPTALTASSIAASEAEARRRDVVSDRVLAPATMAPSRIAILASLSLFTVLCVARPAAASSWRCGPRLVGVGQSTSDVYDLCGEPTDRAARTEYVTVRVSCDVAVTRPVVVEQWLYNRGPKQFQRILTFRDGTLVDIDEGDYGY